MTAEFAGDAFSGDAFSGDAFSGDAFSGDAFSGDAFSGDAFSGNAFSGDAFSGDAFSAAVFGGDAFSGDAFSAAFSSAQTRSLLGVSAFEGLASEGIFVNTWNNSGDFYIRVRGHNGVSSLAAPFHLEVRLEPGTCGNVPGLSNDPILAPTRNARTVILTDESRMSLDVTPPGETQTLGQRLTELANHPAVDGVVVNVNDDLRVRQANQVADNNMSCPYAKNLVARGIKDIVEGYHDQPGSNLEYVVIIGGDEVIPFFRHPDPKILAPESNYAPPVRNSTPSQASLKLDFVLSQDGYGSDFDISMNNSAFPVPDMAVGRLVETPLEIATVINAFLSTGDGVVRPQNSLVTGYDFLEDAANAISDQLQAGTNNDPIELIAPANLPPNSDDPRVWTASDLRTALLNPTTKLDLVFLSGHFTGNSTLAADYTTRLTAREVANASAVDFTNTIVFSAGCHAGYNIVNPHAVPQVTDEIDWPQAFAFKGATVIGGTGYQYGDTERLEYSERIYVEFSRQLRRNTGSPVSIGQTLIAAKQVYLAKTPDIRGLHMKSLLETAIFGLPMLSVDLPGRTDISSPDRLNPGLTPFTTNPGQMLGLRYADVVLNPNLSETIVELTDVENPLDTVMASYLSGTDGVVSNPGEPNLPLEILNVAVDGTMLRGVGFRGGSYVDETIFPLTGAATTEVRSIHGPFQTDYFHRIQPWRINLFDELAGGDPLLTVTPAQHMAGPLIDNLPHSIRRKFSQMNFRIYYSNDVTNYSTDPNVSSILALAGAPLISNVSALPDGNIVLFSATVAGNPAAGVQEAWIVYTVCPGGTNRARS
ncbi:MAG TPA: hypothetical protein VGD99_07720 [Anaerolineae bacterium]